MASARRIARHSRSPWKSRAGDRKCRDESPPLNRPAWHWRCSRIHRTVPAGMSTAADTAPRSRRHARGRSSSSVTVVMVLLRPGKGIAGYDLLRRKNVVLELLVEQAGRRDLAVPGIIFQSGIEILANGGLERRVADGDAGIDHADVCPRRDLIEARAGDAGRIGRRPTRLSRNS